MPRPPDWLIYAGIVGLALFVSLNRRENADAPAAPPPPGAEEGLLLGPETPFDPAVVVDAPQTPLQPASGTAFAVADGRWLSARHVVEGCRSLALVVGGGRAVAAQAQLGARTDVALLTTRGGPEALPVASSGLRVGQRAFHPGFPQGSPGEVTSRLLGRETLHVRGRGARDEPVLAWAEVGRTDGLKGTLAGLSGAPALDQRGRVVGVTLAEAPRRGRVYTTAPETLAGALTAAVGGGRGFGGRAIGLTIDNYGRVADELRRDLRVAQVVCLAA